MNKIVTGVFSKVKMTTKARVWCNFTVKSKKGDLKLRIQDSNREEEILNLFVNHFATQENLNKAAGITKSEEAIKEWKEFGRAAMTQGNTNVCVCCVDDDSEGGGELVAASLMILVSKGDPEHRDFEPKTKEMRKFLELISILDEYDGMKTLEWDKYYDDKGIVVHSDYAGLGIAQKLFNVRRAVCKADGVPYTGAWVTSFGSQKAAERDGHETVSEVSYEELAKRCQVTFENVPPTCKYVVGRAM